MATTNVIFYQDDDGSAPVLEWLAKLPPKALDKCRVKIERLQAMGMNYAAQKRIIFVIRSMNYGLDCKE